MTDFRERYKRLGFDPETNRALRSQRHDEARRGYRDEQKSLRREMAAYDGDDSLLDEDTTASTQQSAFSGLSQDSASCKSADSQGDAKTKAVAEYEAAVQQRWERLQKWREEKNKRKQIEKKKAKPVFKVGVVHHRVYSPPVNKDPAPLPPPKLCKSKDMSANVSQTAPKRVTRATEKRLAIKTIVSQQKRENIRTKKKAQAQVHNPMNEDNQVDIAPKGHMFKAPVGVTPMLIFGRQALEATKENIQAEINSFQISSIVPAFSESFNESSISLKLSSDDQEMMDDNTTNEAKSPVSRRSSKNRSPPAADEANSKRVLPSDQEMMEVEQFSNTQKKNGSFSVQQKTESPVSKRKSQKALVCSPKVVLGMDDSILPKQSNKTPTRKRKTMVEEPKEVVDSPRRTRSTRVADRRRSVRIASTDSADSGIEPSFTPDESSISRRQSVKVVASAGVDSEADSISSPDEEVKPSTSRRRSTKFVPSERLENESAPTPPNKPVNKRRSSKLVSSGSNDKEKDAFVKPAASRRRSTKIISETDALNSGSIVTIADVHHSPLASQEPNVSVKSPLKKKFSRFTANGQENVDFNNTNLMDFTFSAPPKPPKLADAPKSLLDDTIMNLTPRHSSRLPLAEATGNPEEDQPLIRFSSFYVPTPMMNSSSSSEPTKQHSPNEIMNLSLNMSLPKEMEEEKPPAYFSPYIVQSRGKNSARKEMKKRRFSQPGLESEDIPTKDNIMQKLNISVEAEERTAQYYKHILNNEIERLNELCEHWNVIKENPNTPEEIRYIILAACGQTQLLINKKFERFRSLVQDCETGRGEMLVTCKDLQGFWDMMYMEINDCESRFNRLEEMKANNWVEKEDEAIVKEVEKKKKKVPTKKPVAKKSAAAKPSSLRAMIAAARRKKAEADGSVDGCEGTSEESTEKPAEESSDAQKPTTSSKTKSRRTLTPKSVMKWDILRQKVQLSQTRKVTTSPLVVMKLSQMVKTPEVHLDDSIMYINSGRTPAKSILKKDEVMGSVSKSTNKVFFREQSNEVKEFESRNSFVDDNMSLDDIEEVKEPIERKLNFEDESFVENFEEKDKPTEVSSASQFFPSLSAGSPSNSKVVTLTTSPMISMSQLSLEDKESESFVTKNKSTKTKKHISFKQGGDESQSESLRTRKFSAPLTPRPKPRDQEDIEEDMSVEVNDAAEVTPRQVFVKEIYLNEHGVVCERLVSLRKDTPSRSKLKRSHSESTQKSRKINKEIDELPNTPATPRLRRRNTNVPAIQITTPKSTEQELSFKDTLSTPHSKKQSLKRSFADVTLTQDNVDESVEETRTPKLSKRTPKTSKAKSESKESLTQSPTSSLKRKKSLKVTNNEKSIVKRTASPTLKRTTSMNVKSVGAEDSLKEALKRKSVKKLQENIEPNLQETDQSTKEKLLRTPSFKRKSSKKPLEIIEHTEKLTDVSDTLNDTMTPNTRRKSLRITRASIRNEN